MNIRNEITDIIEESMAVPAGITDAANLYVDLGFDSLAFVQLLLRLEEIYHIRIELQEMAICLQVGGLINMVERKVKEGLYDSRLVDESK